MKDDYSDIISLPHYEPARHPRMPIENRAAQFAPFAALTGYEDEIEKTAKQEGQKAELEGDLFASEGRIYD